MEPFIAEIYILASPEVYRVTGETTHNGHHGWIEIESFSSPIR